jgi:ATP-dependent helicase HrpA
MSFYQSRIPKHIVNGAGFEKWRKKAEKDNKNLLFLSREDLMQHQAENVTVDSFPDQMLVNRVALPLKYHFEPGKHDDGITQTIPLSLLNQTNPEKYEWLVPGLLREKVIFLIKSLPKSLRKHFIPVPQFADNCLQNMSPESGALLPALTKELRKLTGVELSESDWNSSDLPIHMQMNFHLVDEQGKLLEQSRDLVYLKKKWAKEAEASFRQMPDSDYEKQGLNKWTFGDFPETVTIKQNGLDMTAYPALVDRGDSVDLTLMDTLKQAKHFSHLGLRRLFMLAQADAVKYLRKNLPNIKTMCLQYTSVPEYPLGNAKNDASLKPTEQLITDLIHVAFDRCFIFAQPEIHSQQDFEQRLEQKRGELVNTASQLTQQFSKPLAEYHQIAKRLSDKMPLHAINAVKDIREQVSHLLYLGCVHDMPDDALQRLPLYFQAIGQRLDKLMTDPVKDRQWAAQVAPHWQRYIKRAKSDSSPELQHYRWMIEEYRISLFAQGLKTAYPISDKRLDKQWALCK